MYKGVDGEQDQSPAGGSNGTEITEDLLPGDTYKAGTDEPDLYFYFTDHLGSTTYITDRKEVAQYVAYTPYGETFKEYKNVTPYKFNGKELDQETGYYYYGARYYDPSTALWFGTDPLAHKYPMNSPYVYCNGNPVKYVDPDGRDAIYIAFPNYRANGIPFTGHAGVLLINNKSGYTKYYEYGRYDTENKGIVRTVVVSNVIIGKNGRPTIKSINNVMHQLSKKSGHGGDIEGAYIISDKFDEMNDYANGKMNENNNPDRTEYSITSNNCATFAEDVITQDTNVDRPTIIIPSPINIVDEYQEEGNAKVQYDSKTNTTVIGEGNEKDAKINVND